MALTVRSAEVVGDECDRRVGQSARHRKGRRRELS